MRVENQWIGEEGGVISSKVIPQVQAVFPMGALNKKIKVGLQVGSCELKHLTRNVAKCAQMVDQQGLRSLCKSGVVGAQVSLPCNRAERTALLH